MDLNELLVKARSDRLSDRELKLVKNIIHSGDSRSGDMYTALHILGVSAGPESSNLVEPYLHYPEDPMISRMAMEVLLGYWGLRKGYEDVLKEFMTGVTWDDEYDVRQAAIGFAGRFASDGEDRADLTKRLLDIADDESDDELMREEAVRALAVAVGDPREILPEASKRVALSSTWSAQILNRARQLLRP